MWCPMMRSMWWAASVVQQEANPEIERLEAKRNELYTKAGLKIPPSALLKNQGKSRK